MVNACARKTAACWFVLPFLLGSASLALFGQSSPLKGERAFSHVKRLVDFGPRPPASPGAKKAQRYITETLRKLELDVEHQNFLASTPNGQIPMKNIIGRLGDRRDRAVILATHYDTLVMKDGLFLGANDGGSSVGLLLELARVLSLERQAFALWFVFFDGEEAQRVWTSTDSLYGSRYFVDRLKAMGRTRQIRAMILMDMVGDKDLALERDTNSTPWLMDLMRQSAAELGYERHLADTPKAVIDDHIPFLQAGVPAVNLIDFEYGPGNRYWHTPQDTLDKVSPRSLLQVGQIVLRMLEKLRDP